MVNTSVFAMTEEAELGLEQLEAVSGGEDRASAEDIYRTLKNKCPEPVREAAEAIEGAGKTVKLMCDNPSLIFTIVRLVF